MEIPSFLDPSVLYTTWCLVLGALMVGQYSYNADGKLQAGRLSVFEADTYALKGDFTLPSASLTLRSSADGKVEFVANIFAGTVTGVDLVSMKEIRALEVDVTPAADKKGHQGVRGMAFIP